jgi:chromosome segregation ATPase
VRPFSPRYPGTVSGLRREIDRLLQELASVPAAQPGRPLSVQSREKGEQSRRKWAVHTAVATHLATIARHEVRIESLENQLGCKRQEHAESLQRDQDDAQSIQKEAKYAQDELREVEIDLGVAQGRLSEMAESAKETKQEHKNTMNLLGWTIGVLLLCLAGAVRGCLDVW